MRCFEQILIACTLITTVILTGCNFQQLEQQARATIIKDGGFGSGGLGTTIIDADHESFVVYTMSGRVTSFSSSIDTPIDLPEELFKYVFVNHGALSGEEPFFERLVRACKQAVLTTGTASVFYAGRDIENTKHYTGFTYDSGSETLVFTDLTENMPKDNIHAFDLSKYLDERNESEYEPSSREARLAKLEKLWEEGLILETDYQKKRAELLQAN